MSDKTPEKSAADILIEMQLEEKRKASLNPLAYTEETVSKNAKSADGAKIASARTYANGATLVTYK